MKKTLLLIAISILFSCKNATIATPEKPSQSVFLFKDRDGLYQYDFATGKEKLLYKAKDFQVFLDEPYELKGDVLTFGFAGQLAASTEYDGTHYLNYYVSLDLKTGKSRVSREIHYDTDMEDKTLTIKTIAIDTGFRQKVIKDTSMPYKGTSTSYRGMEFNRSVPRFFSKHTLGDAQVFSLKGSIYYSKERDTITLIENDKPFEPKFGNGYLQPRLDPKGKYAIFTYAPGFLKGDAELQKVDIATKKVEKIANGEFVAPEFSTDGNFILFRRNTNKNKQNAWESEVYILNLATQKETKIGKASLVEWGI